MRSYSEPPEDDSSSQHGLRGGFPIKINGYALGSQESLQDLGREGSSSRDIFGPRVRSRQGSLAPSDVSDGDTNGRRLSLRGTTPVRIAGMELANRDTPLRDDPFAFVTPFGPMGQSQPGHRGQGGSMGGKKGAGGHSKQRNSSQRVISTNVSEILNSSATENTKYQVSHNVENLQQFEMSSSNNNEEEYGKQTLETTECKMEEKVNKKVTIRASVSDSNICHESFELKHSAIIHDKIEQLAIIEKHDFSNNKNETFENMVLKKSPEKSPSPSCIPSDIESISLGQQNLPPPTQFLLQRPRQFHNSKGEQCVKNSLHSSQNNILAGLPREPAVMKNPTLEIITDKLENAICNMTETLTTFKEDSLQQLEEEKANHVEAALQTMKKNLQVVRAEKTDCKQSSSSHNIDDVIVHMKDTLKGIRNDVDQKTLKDLNREMTPFDMPALSPVPQNRDEIKITKYNVEEDIKKDLLDAREVNVQKDSDSLHNFSRESTYDDSIKNEYSSFCTVNIKTFQSEKMSKDIKTFETESITGNNERHHQIENECKGEEKGKTNNSSNSDDRPGNNNLVDKNIPGRKCFVDPLGSTVPNIVLNGQGLRHENEDAIESRSADKKSDGYSTNNHVISDSSKKVKKSEVKQKVSFSFSQSNDETTRKEEEISRSECNQQQINTNSSINRSMDQILVWKSNKQLESEKTEAIPDSPYQEIISQSESETTESFHRQEEHESTSRNSTCFEKQLVNGVSLKESTGIKEQHQIMINECIQELESSAVFKSSTENKLFEQKSTDGRHIKKVDSNHGINFLREKIIDTDDQEHMQTQEELIHTVSSSEESWNKQTSHTACESVIDTSIETADIDFNMNSKIENDTDRKLDNRRMEDEDNTETEAEDTPKNEKDSSFFLTECTSTTSDAEQSDTSYSFQFNLDPKLYNKRKRNRTIDYHDLPTQWEGSVSTYHERHYADTQTGSEDQEEENATEDKSVDIAKDGLGMILKRLQNIESKLDELKTIETSILTVGHESRRHSLPGNISTLQTDTLINLTSNLPEENENALTRTPTEEDLVDDGPEKPGENGLEEGEENWSIATTRSSTHSSPTVMGPIPKVPGYESDDTAVHESDYEVETGGEEDGNSTTTYRSFQDSGLNIREISECEISEDEDLEDRRIRIEAMAASINLPGPVERRSVRPEMNMEIDTLSERSEEEEGHVSKEPQPERRQRRMSGRKRSMSRERNVAKIRYCWRCHHAGHENWQCQEDVQPGGWCPRCLETSHWEDACWVEAAHVLCPICSIPGHLPCVHQATDFRQRKLVVDTFGWLAFKEWFQDMTFRSWWNCSGYTGVPLYKIMQRNPSQDLDLGFEEPQK